MQNIKTRPVIRVGLTGGIGSGKSTVADIFSLLGVPVYNADLEAKKLMTSDKSLKNKIKALIGKSAYYKNGRLNRKYIADKIFNNDALLGALNDLVHPAVAQDLSKWFSEQNTTYAIQEAAIIFEHGSQKKFDTTILVTAPKEMRIERVCLRDSVDRPQVLKRMDAQMLESEKMKLANYLITNDLKSSLIEQVIVLDKKIRTLKLNLQEKK